MKQIQRVADESNGLLAADLLQNSAGHSWTINRGLCSGGEKSVSGAGEEAGNRTRKIPAILGNALLAREENPS
jgi:hypothetical protein